MDIGRWIYKERLKLAWALLPEAKKAKLQPLIDAAHQQLQTFRATGQAPHDPTVPHELTLAKTALTDDAEGLVAGLPEPEAEAVEIAVDPGGAIWGTGKYQQLDPGWLEAAAVWLEHLIFGRHSFPAGEGPVIAIPDELTIALAGDFGTGNFGTAADPSPAVKIASKVIPSLAPDLTIHLGDVYYAGTSDQEADNLLKLWPSGKAGLGTAFTLNSNHEMYSGGDPYFDAALKSQLFLAQAPYSFFALENSNWVIVALDSAYYADELSMYMNGSIGPATGAQATFLQAQARKGKKVVVITHHNGLEEVGSIPARPGGLWSEVMACFPDGTAPAYWYWGHVHAGVVYETKANGVKCRCTGYSALPWGYASELAGNGDVVWFESRNAGDPADQVRVLNGMTLLNITAAGLSETFYDENNGTAWLSAPAAKAATQG
jgi:hypothetical protein